MKLQIFINLQEKIAILKTLQSALETKTYSKQVSTVGAKTHETKQARQ